MGRRGRQVLALCGALSFAATFLVAGAGARDEPVPGLEVEGIELSRGQPDVGAFQHSVLIRINTGFCSGELPPVFDHFDVVERPKSAQRPFKSVVVTAYVRFPGREVSARKPCAGLGYDIEKRVKTKRPVSRLIFFDGSEEPPLKIGRPPGADD